VVEVSAQAVFGADPAAVVQSALAAHRSWQRRRWEEHQRPVRQLRASFAAALAAGAPWWFWAPDE
jgi:hypothetical protein